MRKVSVKEILEATTHSARSLDLTHLPIFTINNANPLQCTNNSLIDKQPTEVKFSFAFEDYDLSLEEVQSYSIVAHGVICSIVIINTILIIFWYLGKIFRKGAQTRSGYHNELETGLRKKFEKYFYFARDSLKKIK